MINFNPSAIEGLFLDLDDTLYDYHPCNERGNQETFSFLTERLERPMAHIEEAFHTGRKKTKALLSGQDFELAASHSRLLYFQKAIEHLTGKTEAKLTLECERRFWSSFLHEMKLLPGALRFLQAAKKKKMKMVIITDMTVQVQLQKILKLGIADHIDFIVSSEEAGREKPHPAVMQLALEKTGLKPDQVVMIGEDEKRDVLAAQAANITPISIRYRPSSPSVMFAKNFRELGQFLQL